MSDDDYQVGYGRPPKHSQFKKGRSGNPSGRPRRPEADTAALIQKVCNELVTVREGNGRKRKMRKIEAIMTQLMNSAAKGDPRAAREVFSILKQFPKLMEPPLPQPLLHIHFVESDGNGRPAPGTEERIAREQQEFEEELKRKGRKH